ncbi:MAG: SRPBCC family protein [Flavobacteriales bacterium]
MKRFLRYFLIGLSVLIGLVLIAALIYPQKLEVKKTRLVEGPKSKVKKHIVDLKRFKKWSPFGQKDSNVTFSFEGKMGEPGSRMKWEGAGDLGSGAYTLKRETQDSVILQLEFFKPHQSKSKSYFLIEKVAQGTKVSWGIEEELSWPGNAIPHFMGVERAIGKRFDKGLKGLAEMVEKPGDKGKGS